MLSTSGLFSCFIYKKWIYSNKFKRVLGEPTTGDETSVCFCFLFWPDRSEIGWPAGCISGGLSCRRGCPALWPPGSAPHQRSRTGPGAECPSSAQKYQQRHERKIRIFKQFEANSFIAQLPRAVWLAILCSERLDEPFLCSAWRETMWMNCEVC